MENNLTINVNSGIIYIDQKRRTKLKKKKEV